MSWKHLAAAAFCTVSLCATQASAAESIPLKQGLHQWNALGGKLFLVVGTYQDTTTFRRNYTFYFKEASDDAWNQVPVVDKKPQFTWDGAVGAEVTLADGTVAVRKDSVYFIVADKRVGQNYHDKGDITVTWYKLTAADDSRPDDIPYQFKPVFTRAYPKSAQTVEAILARENTLQPAK